NCGMDHSPAFVDPNSQPMLRPGLAAEPANGRVVIVDQLRVGNTIEITAFGFELVRRFDGNRTLRDLQREVMELAGGQLVPLEAITALATGLDEALLLDTPRFRDRISGPVRKPSCLGCYDPDPVKMRAQFTELFT